jgi:curved DNA-binding protein
MLGASVVVRGPDGELDITVPAGWTSGRKLRLKGRGIPGKTPGDLFLEMLITLPEAHTESDRAAYAALAAAFPTFAPRLKP